MANTNNSTLIRRDLIIRLCRLYLRGRLKDLDRIPLKIAPRGIKNMSRCCTYKTRAILKYRIMALLGFNVADETDELATLQSYAARAQAKENRGNGILTIVDEACTSCVKSQYVVSNLCKGCLASYCLVSCPKKAITFTKEQAEINPDLCVNCGICNDVCPYNAIIRVPVPCEESCPVKAISKDENGVEVIDYDRCIHCGKCMTSCPFGAIMYESKIINILDAIHKSGKPVVAMLAPAIFGQFKADYAKVRKAVLQLGFADVIEVALGAEETARHEAAELGERLAQGDQFMTTSCCPAYMECVEKHIPQLLPFVSHTPSPMHYTALLAKDRFPGCVTVFVGPCVAKQAEAFKDPVVDYVMTFEELGALFAASKIDVINMEGDAPGSNVGIKARAFARSGGVLGIVKQFYKHDDLQPLIISGLDRKSLALLGKMPVENGGFNFVEVMACEGGCLSGPGSISQPKVAVRLFDKQSDSN